MTKRIAKKIMNADPVRWYFNYTKEQFTKASAIWFRNWRRGKNKRWVRGRKCDCATLPSGHLFMELGCESEEGHHCDGCHKHGKCTVREDHASV